VIARALRRAACLFGAHKFEVRQYRAPYKWPAGFFTHWGLISTCTVCGKVVDSERLDLPILEPEFERCVDVRQWRREFEGHWLPDPLTLTENRTHEPSRVSLRRDV
jgi:hypothetical protein